MYFGVDVSKSALDVKGTEWSKVERFKNTAEGIASLVERIREGNPKLVVMEATGGYERAVAKALSEAKIAASVMNPRHTRNFSKALGKVAKTDSIDATALSEFAKRLEPAPTRVISDEEHELRQLVVRRTQLVRQRVQEKNRLEQATPPVAQSIKVMIKHLGAEIRSITKQIDVCIAKSETLKERATKLQSARGVGKVVAYTLCAQLPELGQLNRKEIAALVGVAPLNRDSGEKSGNRYVMGGRGGIRAALYMAAMAAVRSEGTMKNFYQRLIDSGKRKMVALVACMRKLLVCLNAMMKTNTTWGAHLKTDEAAAAT